MSSTLDRAGTTYCCDVLGRVVSFAHGKKNNQLQELSSRNVYIRVVDTCSQA